jgi:hypothetical protein
VYGPKRADQEGKGTGARFLSEPVRAAVDATLLARIVDRGSWIVVRGGLGQMAGLALHFWTMWTRIRPLGSPIREATGERF